MGQPARSQYAATRPAVLDWFKHYNEGKPYAQQVKPFNFMLQFYALRQDDMQAAHPDRIWEPKLGELAPVAPFDKDLSKAVLKVFDRNSNPLEPVEAAWLRSMANVLRDYHRQPEYKFLGGGWTETGILRRRHVLADGIEDIGKESEGWEEDDANALSEPTVVSYGSSPDDTREMRELIMSVAMRQLKREARIGMRTIVAVSRGDEVSHADLKRLADAARRIIARREKLGVERFAVMDWLKREHAARGLAQLANDLGVDKTNLLKVIKGERKPSKALAANILGLIRAMRAAL
jgi:hypothetical protein